MKNLVFLVVMPLFSISNLFAQLTLETFQYRGGVVIRPSLGNLVKLVRSDYNTYKKAISLHGYQASSVEPMYCANSIEYTYCISKKTGEVMMFFASDESGFVSSLRKQLRESKVRPSYEKGLEVYRITLPDSGRITILINESSDGSSFATIEL